WVVVSPLIAGRQGLLSFSGLLLGPPVVLLASIALIAGFVFLLASVLPLSLAAPLAPLVRWPLAWCDALVEWGDRLPGGCWYPGELPVWWLAGFYLLALGFLMLELLPRFWREALLAGVAWLCVGAVATWPCARDCTLGVTFLAGGHGTCVVIQTREGQTLLYDAGAIRGQDVTRRVIAPFLRSRGIRRLDDVFLSHADYDHFCGLPQ